jgi:hypothetical protein
MCVELVPYHVRNWRDVGCVPFGFGFVYFCIHVHMYALFTFGNCERRRRKIQKESRKEGKSERRIDREVGNFGMRGKLMEKISRRTWKMNI